MFHRSSRSYRFHPHRSRSQKLPGHFIYSRRKSRRKQQSLMLLRNNFQYTSQLRHKPQIHQTVRLIHHHCLNLTRPDNTIHINIHEPAWSSHQHIRPLIHSSLLRPDIRPTIYPHTPEVHKFRQQLHTFTDLYHQLPGRNNNQGPRITPLGIMQLHQQRYQISQSLSRSGLSYSYHILSRPDNRKSLFLNRSRLFKTRLFQSHEYLFTNIQIPKSHITFIKND